MKDSRKGMGLHASGTIAANDASTVSDGTVGSDEQILTSPAFDRWLERQMQTLFAACEEPADPKLVELIRQAFPPGRGKVTE
ncbi:hypothetical protein [Dongia rigui]|uniref:Anti-sigma factor NepR domain-containing protein n=1 Tax=Dongia rigui TaxID=940149 RepID=A0ABU5E235_9PROT|nr:hypothetical protein [Dongia rigui]MDY0873630.1 hypothetical protein [Dongia rigui]